MTVDASAGVFEALFPSTGDVRPVPSTVVVVAHPDDEVIGAGGQLCLLHENTWVVCVTDGAPDNMADAARAGIHDRREYAAERRREFHSALALSGVTADRTRCLNLPDQQASLNLNRLVESLGELFCELRPEAVLTHPYEGGHPDHDATALAVHVASRQIEREGKQPPEIIEMAFYHNRAGSMAVGEFLPAAGGPIRTVELSEGQRRLKRAMLECHRTQGHMLKYFPIDVERFRIAAPYDFTRPPHSGELFYEQFDWGMTGGRFVRLACGALDTFGL